MLIIVLFNIVLLLSKQFVKISFIFVYSVREFFFLLILFCRYLSTLKVERRKFESDVESFQNVIITSTPGQIQYRKVSLFNHLFIFKGPGVEVGYSTTVEILTQGEEELSVKNFERIEYRKHIVLSEIRQKNEIYHNIGSKKGKYRNIGYLTLKTSCVVLLEFRC